MFLFVGDSFTWGQGLYFERWVQQKLISDTEEINKFTPADFRHECLNFEDNQFRINHAFPHLVAKHYNVNYFTPRFMNGGSNYDILYELRNGIGHQDEIVSHVVIQLTDFWRPMNPNHKQFFSEEQQNGADIHTLEQFYGRSVTIFNEMIDSQLSALEEDFWRYRKAKVYVLSWQNDIAQKFKERFGDERLIQVHYNNQIYDSFDWVLDELSLKKKYNIFDNHFTIEGHKIIADSIIKKIGEFKTDIDSYKFLKENKYN